LNFGANLARYPAREIHIVANDSYPLQQAFMLQA
jgi:hypothetical protein